jgi:hypothetical protein
MADGGVFYSWFGFNDVEPETGVRVSDTEYQRKLALVQ